MQAFQRLRHKTQDTGWQNATISTSPLKRTAKRGEAHTNRTWKKKHLAPQGNRSPDLAMVKNSKPTRYPFGQYVDMASTANSSLSILTVWAPASPSGARSLLLPLRQQSNSRGVSLHTSQDLPMGTQSDGGTSAVLPAQKGSAAQRPTALGQAESHALVLAQQPRC
jgi:hypothetical protein